MNRSAMTAGLLLGTLGVFALGVCVAWPFTVDDSYITYRYSLNAAGGHGFRYNATDARPTEGCTSFLWALALVIPAACSKGTIEPFSKVIGVLLSMGSAWLIFKSLTIREQQDSGIGGRGAAPAAFGAVFLLCGWTVVHAISGMETALAALLMSAICYAVLRILEEGPTRGRFHLLAVLLLLLGLCRPELNLFAAALVVTLLVVPGAVPSARKSLLRSVLVFYVLPGLVYFAWRMHYFGTFLPLPFYLKSGRLALSGAGSVAAFVSHGFIVFLLLCAFLRRPDKTLWAIGLPTLAVLAYLCFPKHLMGFEHRLMYPLLPGLVILAGRGVQGAFPAASPRLASIVLPALLLLALAGRTWQGVRLAPYYAAGLQCAHRQVAEGLVQRHGAGQQNRLAVVDAGLIPFVSDWTTVDTLGLNSRIIARDPTRRDELIWSNPPTALVLISDSADEFKAPAADRDIAYCDSVYAAARARGYVRVDVRRFWEDYYLWVLEPAP